MASAAASSAVQPNTLPLIAIGNTLRSDTPMCRLRTVFAVEISIMLPPQGDLRIFGAARNPGATYPNRYRTVLDGAMTNQASPTAPPKPWIWLVIAGVLSVVSIAWLWSMTGPRVCILIYPAPPGCATVIPNWLPFVRIGIIAALFIAMIVLYLRAKAGRRPGCSCMLTIAIAVVALLTALIMLLAGLGVFDRVPAAGDRRT